MREKKSIAVIRCSLARLYYDVQRRSILLDITHTYTMHTDREKPYAGGASHYQKKFEDTLKTPRKAFQSLEVGALTLSPPSLLPGDRVIETIPFGTNVQIMIRYKYVINVPLINDVMDLGPSLTPPVKSVNFCQTPLQLANPTQPQLV